MLGGMSLVVAVVVFAVAIVVAIVVAAVVVARAVVARAVAAAPASDGPPVADPSVVAAEVAALAEQLRAQAASERDAAVRAALEQAAVLQREALGASLAAGRDELVAKKDVIDARLEQVRHEMRGELERMGALVQQLGAVTNRSFGEVTAALSAHAETTSALARTTQGLREALANPKARGQWGERMAEDILRLAGFVENVNYTKQRGIDSGGIPDFTFPLPKGHVLYMDVKFPLTAYLRFLESGTDAERSAHRDAFLRDVRLRVRELAGRDYARGGRAPSVDYVLLFLPNETITTFLFEHDPALFDDSLGQRVVLCTPMTLFALLGVIRQAYDNFMVEQTSEEILRVLGSFETQWGKFAGALDLLGKRLESAQKAYEDLNGTRRRQLEKPLGRLGSLRAERGIAVPAEIGGDRGGEVLELGA
jgi:DNA recombination protein RmuC